MNFSHAPRAPHRIPAPGCSRASTSFLHRGGPAHPDRPTFLVPLNGKPSSPRRHTLNVGTPAKSDGSPLIKLKNSCWRRLTELCTLCSAPLNVWNAGPLHPADALILPVIENSYVLAHPSSLAFATAAFIIFLLVSEEDAVFLDPLAIGLPPLLYCIGVCHSRTFRACVGSCNHSAIHVRFAPVMYEGLRTGDNATNARPIPWPSRLSA